MDYILFSSMPTGQKGRAGWLILETGEIYEGVSCGTLGESCGAVVVNTGPTGDNGIITDPS